MSRDPKRLDTTVRGGARGKELAYYEAHRAAGTEVRGRYRPENQYSKATPSDPGGDGKLARKANRVSWKKGTGVGSKSAKVHTPK